MPEAAPPSTGTPALDEGPRIGWGLALRLLLWVAGAAVIGFLFVVEGGLPAFFGAIFQFLVLRIVGDGARAFGGRTPTTMAIEGFAKAAAWAVLGVGLWSTLVGPAPFWVYGGAAAIAGLSLWGHHSQTEPVSRRVAVTEGVVGAALAALGLAAAASVLPLSPPWATIVPFVVFALAAAVAARAVVRLVRRTKKGAAPQSSGFGAWYQEHFFRLTLLVIAILVYVLFIRATIRGFVPLLFLFEYSAAVLVLGFVLWSLRGFLRRRLVESPIQSPRRRHEQAVERQGESGFDAVEDAFGRFLEFGDPSAVEGLSKTWQEAGVKGAQPALGSIVAYNARDDLLLIHPGWLYGARLAALALVLLAVATVTGTIYDSGGPSMGPMLLPATLAIGLYIAQWNRYGGPWGIRTGLGYAGLAIALLSPDLRGIFFENAVGLAILAALAALPLLQPLRARKGRPVPRYAYRGSDPLGAIERLRTTNEGMAVRRLLWTTAIGVAVFFVVGEMSRFIPGFALVFTVYLFFAALVVLGPAVNAAGLRLGAREVQRRHERERAERGRLLKGAMPRLDQAFAATGRHGGPLLGARGGRRASADRTETR